MDDKNELVLRVKKIAQELNYDEEIDWNDNQQKKYYIKRGATEEDKHKRRTYFTLEEAKSYKPDTIYCLDPRFLIKVSEQMMIGEFYILFED